MTIAEISLHCLRASRHEIFLTTPWLRCMPHIAQGSAQGHCDGDNLSMTNAATAARHLCVRLCERCHDQGQRWTSYLHQ